MTLPAHKFLDIQGIPYQPLTFPPGTEKGAANVARALGYKERQMIKTLIFETHQGERVLVMIGGDQKAISGMVGPDVILRSLIGGNINISY